MKQKKISAVSPVIATLLLIAIAVASAILVFGFVTGLMGGVASGGSGLIVESGTLSIPTGIATDGSHNLGDLVITIKNSGSTPVATIKVIENTNTAICDSAVGTDALNHLACAANNWAVVGGANTWTPAIPGGAIAVGQTLSLSTPITGFTTAANAGASDSYTITVTFTTASGSNIQTLSIVAET